MADDLGLAAHTLGDVALRTQALRIVCTSELRRDGLDWEERCGYATRITVASLIDSYGRDMMIRDLRERFKCGRCGSRKPGYLVGRIRTASDTTVPEGEVNDCVHGLLVWGLATLLTGLLVAFAATAATRLVAPGSATGPQASVAGENIIAYDLDRLFRSDRRLPAPELTAVRSEASRILLTAAGHTGLTSDDRTALIRLTSQITGLTVAEATTRVDNVVVSAAANISRGRKAGVVLAFMIGAAGMIGALIAMWAARAGGHTRREIERGVAGTVYRF